MQCIYNHIPETSHVSSVYSVAAVLCVQFVLHVMLFRPRITFCAFISALSAVCVHCPIWLIWYSNPITDLDRPRRLQEAQAASFQDSRHINVVRLSALRTGRLYPPENTPGTHFC